MSRRVFERCEACGINCIPPARPGVPRRTICISCEKGTSDPTSVFFGRRTAAASPVAQFSGDFSAEPIEGMEVLPMKANAATKFKEAPKAKAAPLPVSLAAVEQSAIEYQAMKAELERVGGDVEKLNKFLKEQLPHVEGKAVPVNDGKELYLSEPDPSLSFDLKSAEETLADSVLKKLEPYIEKKRTLDLEAALRHLDPADWKPLKKFIVKKENTPTLRFRDRKD